MGKSFYKVSIERLFDSESFTSATKEELRTLVAIALGGAVDEEELASLASVSVPRCRSAIALFEAEGIIERESVVSEEFGDAPHRDEDDVEEDGAIKVARDIRDGRLASLISEFSKIMGSSALSTTSVKKIVSLYTNYALSEEYILTLGAYLADSGRLTVTRLVNEAIKLVEREIDTPEALCEYIEERSKRTDAEARIRNLLGIRGRKITKRESDAYNKWVGEYGFSEEIINEAFEITVSQRGEFNLPYMDAILSRWGAAGCKTLSECHAASERDRTTLLEEKKGRRTERKREKSEEPKYAAFSAEDALMRALERSYGSSDEEG